VRARATVREVREASPDSETDSGEAKLPNTKSLARDKELNKLLALYNSGDKDFLSSSDTKKSTQASSQGEKPKKHLSITDFLTKTQGSHTEDEEVLVTTTGGKLTFKSAVHKKVEVQNVSVGQWIAANSRIFDILSPSMSFNQVLCYNEYVKQIGDLLDLYTTPSVMVLDEEHRRWINFTGRPWDEISLHLERLHLKIKNPQATPVVSVAGSVPVVSKKKKSNNLCFGYNSKPGCTNGDGCGYKHVCSYRTAGVL
jgi:hypothetical protein